MHFLIVSQHFHPDTFSINEVAQALAKQGHRVRVLTGLPDYNAQTLPPEYRWFKRRREVWNGVEITRVPTTLRRHGAFWRLVNYASFVVSGWLWASFAEKGADVVLTFQTSPVSMAIPAQRLAQRNHCPHVLWCLDLWPESMTVWGVKPGSLLFSLVSRLSGRIYRAADRVAYSSKPGQGYLRQVNGVASEKLCYLPQPCVGELSATARQYEDNGVTDFLFAGNLGAAQAVDTILDAAALLRGKGGFHVHIVGDGSEKQRLEALAAKHGLSTIVTFHGRKPVPEMSAYYRLADACLLTLQGDGFVRLLLPAKLQSYLSAGKPIVAAAAADGAVAEVLAASGAGLCAPAGDAAALATQMAQIMADPAAAQRMGESGYQYFQQEFAMDAFLLRLHEIVRAAKDTPAPSGQGGRHHV